ncbi:MAG: glycosyltransferase family 4 protein [Marinobacter adhaerens]
MNLLVISSSAPHGKGENFVISEVNEIAGAGHKVTLFPTIIRKGNPNRFELNPNVCLLSKSTFSLSVVSAFLRFVLLKPSKFFGIVKFVSDKSIKNTLKNIFVIPKSIWLAERLEETSISHIHAHWLTTSSTLAMVVGKLTGIPWSVTAHRGDIVASNLLNEKFREAKFLRFISNSGVTLAEKIAQLDRGKVHILHMGVNVPEILVNDVAAKGEKKKRLRLVCPANLLPVKGHAFLLQALSLVKNRNDIFLVFAGDGKLRDALESQVEKLALKNIVSFEGHVPHYELLNWYRSCVVDLVILPSRDLGGGVHEGIPVSLMEAMSFCIPVISTRTGGIPELLEDERGDSCGGLVEPDDYVQLARVLDNFIESKELRAKVGMSGYLRVKRDFNLRTIAEDLVSLMVESDTGRDEISNRIMCEGPG